MDVNADADGEGCAGGGVTLVPRLVFCGTRRICGAVVFLGLGLDAPPFGSVSLALPFGD